MQRTVRILKVALPILFVGFIVIIVRSFGQQRGPAQQVERGPGHLHAAAQRQRHRRGDGVRRGADDRRPGGLPHAREARGPARIGLDDAGEAYLTIYRSNGLTYEVVCPEAQFHSETKEAEAKGGVRVSSSDGIEIRTAEIKFDGNRLTNDIPVEFKIDRWNGKAGALDLDVAGRDVAAAQERHRDHGRRASRSSSR